MKRDFSIELALEEAMENYMRYYYKDKQYAEQEFEDDFRMMAESIIDEIWPEEEEYDD